MPVGFAITYIMTFVCRSPKRPNLISGWASYTELSILPHFAYSDCTSPIYINEKSLVSVAVVKTVGSLQTPRPYPVDIFVPGVKSVISTV